MKPYEMAITIVKESMEHPDRIFEGVGELNGTACAIMLAQEVILLRQALVKVIPALVWYFEGPYGRSPDPSDLQLVRHVLGDE